MDLKSPQDRSLSSILSPKSPRSFFKPLLQSSLLSARSPPKFFPNLDSSEQVPNINVKQSFMDNHLKNDANIQIFRKDLVKTHDKANPTHFNRNISYLFNRKKGKSMQIPQLVSPRKEGPTHSNELVDLYAKFTTLKHQKTPSISLENLSFEKSNLQSNFLIQNSSICNNLEKISVEKVPKNNDSSSKKILDRHLKAQGKRMEVIELSSWTENQISTLWIAETKENYQKGVLSKSLQIYNTSLQELVKQISIENKTQGDFLAKIWTDLQNLIEKAILFEAEQQLQSEKRLLALLETTHGKYQEKLDKVTSEYHNLMIEFDKCNEKNKILLADSRYLKKKEKKYGKDFKALRTHLSELQTDNANLVKDNVRLAMHNQEIDAQAALELNQRYLETIKSSLEVIMDEKKGIEKGKIKKIKEIIEEIDTKTWGKKEVGKVQKQKETEIESNKLLNYLQNNMEFLKEFDEKHKNLLNLPDTEEFFLSDKGVGTEDLISKTSRGIQIKPDMEDMESICKLLVDPEVQKSEMSIQCNLTVIQRGRFRTVGVQVRREGEEKGVQTIIDATSPSKNKSIIFKDNEPMEIALDQGREKGRNLKKRGSLYDQSKKEKGSEYYNENSSPKSKKKGEQSNFTKKENNSEKDDLDNLGDNENKDDNSKEHYITKAKNIIKEKLKEKFKNEKSNFEENKEQDSNFEVKLLFVFF